MHRNNISSWLSYDVDIIMNMYSRKYFDIIKSNPYNAIDNLPLILKYSETKYDFYFGTLIYSIYIIYYFSSLHLS